MKITVSVFDQMVVQITVNKFTVKPRYDYINGHHLSPNFGVAKFIFRKLKNTFL
jgi:hypothetical protein